MFTKYLWVLPNIDTFPVLTPADLPHPLPILVLDYTLRA